MVDREKVKKGLDLCLTGEPARCKDCPYDAECKEARGIGPSPLRRDALELLKEQEAVEPEAEVMNEIDRLYRCPKCHKCFFYKKQKYCDQCGQAVKWDV